MSSRALLASAWTILVLALCLVPSYWLPVLETESSPSQFFLGRDKIVHYGLFASLSFLWMRVIPTWRGTALVIVGGLALAILTELGQGLSVIGRDSDPLDAFADAVGTFAGVAVYWSWRVLTATSPPDTPESSITPEY